MKIISAEKTSSFEDGFAYRILPDSSLLRNNEDFYFPNLPNVILVGYGIFFKIKKIGKCFAPKFSNRYFDECGVALNFIASDIQRQLLTNGLPDDIAFGFDKSFAISPVMFSKENLQNPIEFKRNEELVIVNSPNESDIHDAVSKASFYYTLKIGDLFYLELGRFEECAIGDKLTVFSAEENLLSCLVK